MVSAVPSWVSAHYTFAGQLCGVVESQACQEVAASSTLCRLLVCPLLGVE